MGFQNISALAFAERWRKGEIEASAVIDIREPYEWFAFHLKGSTWIPMGEIPDRMQELPRDKPLYILCAHGVRSAYTCQYLQHQGFQNLINVQGGIAEVLQYIPETEVKGTE